MTPHPSPHVSRGPRIPLVWLAPVIALLIGGWMLFAEYRTHGPEIVIDFEEGAGVEAGKTRLEYKGVTVGIVRDVRLKSDLSGITVRLRLDRNAASLAAEGSQFWIVQPEISLGAVRGLDTILKGARISVIPGRGGPAEHFTGYDRAPLPRGRDGSRSFVLENDRLGSLSTGSPVFYREVKVGIVEGSRLADDSASVRIRIRIDAPYVDLVRTNTRFWNAGGFSVKVGLFGIEAKNSSLESLINGAVAFATPNSGPLAPPAPAGMQFALAHESEKSWLTWRPKIAIHPHDAELQPPSPAGLLPHLPVPAK